MRVDEHNHVVEQSEREDGNDGRSPLSGVVRNGKS
jgi:hypothetical protein